MARSVVVTEERVDKAKEFKDAYDEFWLGLGRTSEWDDEDNPPEPTGDESTLDELFGYVLSQVEVDWSEEDKKCVFAVEDEENYDFIYRDRYYRKVEDGNEYDEEATTLYFRINIDIEDFDSVEEFRQVGVFYDVVRDTDNTSSDATVLDYDGTTDDDVDDEGNLYALSNVRAIERASDRSETIMVMIDF